MPSGAKIRATMPNPYRDFPFSQPVCIGFSLKAELVFSECRRGTKWLNREQTATLQTALLQPPAHV